MAHRVLVVEDDDRIAAPLVRTLEREGYAVTRVDSGLRAIALLTSDAVSGRPELVLLDLGLPDIDGLDVCRKAREAGFSGGVIILSARDGELDRVVGLDVGADDYLAKPFGLAELLARVRAALRRSAPAGAVPVDVAPAPAGFRVDASARRVWNDDAEVQLTSKEFDVLAMLGAERGAVITRERLISEIWDENWFGSTKTLDATVGRLRQKLDEAGAPVRVTTVRGIGFRWEDVPGA